MRFSKVFSFFAFILSIKLLNLCHCKTGDEGNSNIQPSGNANEISPESHELLARGIPLDKLKELEKRKAREKILLITSIVSAVLGVLGTSLGFGLYAKEKIGKKEGGKPEDKPKGDDNKTITTDDDQ